jgi:hypothetical protein
LENYVDKEKYCLRGIESYLVPGQRQKELSHRRDAIDAVLIEADDQLHFDENDPEKIRMALEPTSRHAARVAFSQATTDASMLVASTHTASTKKTAILPWRQQSLPGGTDYLMRRLSWTGTSVAVGIQ